MHKCNYCNYKTDIVSNFNKHLKTKKHFKNIENVTINKKSIENTIIPSQIPHNPSQIPHNPSQIPHNSSKFPTKYFFKKN